MAPDADDPAGNSSLTLRSDIKRPPLAVPNGVTPEDLPEFTKSVMQTQTRLMSNSFTPLDESCVLKIYQELY